MSTWPLVLWTIGRRTTPSLGTAPRHSTAVGSRRFSVVRPPRVRRSISRASRSCSSAACAAGISEVPVTAYLSRGLDSSTIVAALTQHTAKPVRTLTVGFDYQHDEPREAGDNAAEVVAGTV